VRSDVTAEALAEAIKELDSLKDPKRGKPLRAEELARARADLVQSVGARLEVGARIGSTLAELWLHRLPADYYNAYPNVLAKETPDSLLKVTEALDPEHLVIVVVGDGKLVTPGLTKLGYQVVPAPAQLIE
jgi:zinc protease